MNAKIPSIVEFIRWILIITAFQLAYALGTNPADRFELLTPLVIIPLSGITGLESIFLGKSASQASGYAGERRYQIQSGLNNIAVAVATLIAWWCKWGIAAYFSLMTATLIFYGLSGANHAASTIFDGNLKWKNVARPFMSLVLIIAVLIVMLPALPMQR